MEKEAKYVQPTAEEVESTSQAEPNADKEFDSPEKEAKN